MAVRAAVNPWRQDVFECSNAFEIDEYNPPLVARELYPFPLLGYMAAYSILPHKGWRFFTHVLPLLMLAGTVGSACLGSAISSWNYPGGEALNRLHTLLAESDISPPGT
jgi:hypothetical protein